MSVFRTLEDAVARGTGTERTFHCPQHDDRNASASVNVVKGLWYCYACHAGGRVQDSNITSDRLVDDISVLLAQIPQIVYPESWWDLFDRESSYWNDRFDQSVIKHFRLGVDPKSGLPCYPLRNRQQQILGPVTRAPDGEEPKYHYPYQVDVGSLLYNADVWAHDRVVVVEGATDVWAAWEVGEYAVGLLGNRFTQAKAQIMLKMAPELIIVATDQDVAGRLAAADIMNWADQQGIPAVRPQWRGKDLCDLLPKHRKYLLQSLALGPTLF